MQADTNDSSTVRLAAATNDIKQIGGGHVTRGLPAWASSLDEASPGQCCVGVRAVLVVWVMAPRREMTAKRGGCATVAGTPRSQRIVAGEGGLYGEAT